MAMTDETKKVIVGVISFFVIAAMTYILRGCV
jgi:hypothetical protein